MELGKVSGVGKVTLKKLNNLALFTGKDIRESNEDYLVQHLGRYGKDLWSRCQRIDERKIETTRIRKSIRVEKTFHEDISDIEQLRKLMREELIPELVCRSKRHLETRTISKLGVHIELNEISDGSSLQLDLFNK